MFETNSICQENFEICLKAPGLHLVPLNNCFSHINTTYILYHYLSVQLFLYLLN